MLAVKGVCMIATYKLETPINGVDTLKFDSMNLTVGDLLSIDDISKRLFAPSEDAHSILMDNEFISKSHCIALAWVSCKKNDPKLNNVELSELPLEVAYWLNETGFTYRALQVT